MTEYELFEDSRHEISTGIVIQEAYEQAINHERDTRQSGAAATRLDRSDIHCAAFWATGIVQ